MDFPDSGASFLWLWTVFLPKSPRHRVAVASAQGTGWFEDDQFSNIEGLRSERSVVSELRPGVNGPRGEDRCQYGQPRMPIICPHSDFLII